MMDFDPRFYLDKELDGWVVTMEPNDLCPPGYKFHCGSLIGALFAMWLGARRVRKGRVPW